MLVQHLVDSETAPVTVLTVSGVSNTFDNSAILLTVRKLSTVVIKVQFTNIDNTI